MTSNARCQAIELILTDVDGVLTDGALVFDNQGVESKSFHIRDGLGIRLWQRAGGKFGILTGRSSHVVELRAAELGIELVRQGIDDKRAALGEMLDALGLGAEQTCYIGDDLPDVPIVKAVGFGVAVADACPELREAALFVTSSPGGRGAVRETIEHILKAQHRWSSLLQAYEISAPRSGA